MKKHDISKDINDEGYEFLSKVPLFKERVETICQIEGKQFSIKNGDLITFNEEAVITIKCIEVGHSGRTQVTIQEPQGGCTTKCTLLLNQTWRFHVCERSTLSVNDGCSVYSEKNIKITKTEDGTVIRTVGNIFTYEMDRGAKELSANPVFGSMAISNNIIWHTDSLIIYSSNKAMEYYYCPNRQIVGVNVFAYQIDKKYKNPLLISSGSLSGCMTCSLIFDDLILFTHAGGEINTEKKILTSQERKLCLMQDTLFAINDALFKLGKKSKESRNDFIKGTSLESSEPHTMIGKFLAYITYLLHTTDDGSCNQVMITFSSDSVFMESLNKYDYDDLKITMLSYKRGGHYVLVYKDEKRKQTAMGLRFGVSPSDYMEIKYTSSIYQIIKSNRA